MAYAGNIAVQPGESHFASYLYEKDGAYIDGDTAVLIRSAPFPLQIGGAHQIVRALFKVLR